MEFRELRAFVAVVEEGSLSAASRRLHVSQPALSQTVNALERELGVELLSRSNVGVQATEAGQALLVHARTLLALHDRAVADISGRTDEHAGVLRLGVPLELPSAVLADALAQLATTFPDTRVQARHLSTAAQLSALKADELDVALVREHPVGHELDSTLVLEERLGVLLSAERADALSAEGGVRLESLRGLTWLAFARSGSPAWFDEIVAVLRSHGLDIAAGSAGDQLLIPEVKLAAVQGGTAFSLAPPNWSQPIPPGVRWCPLNGSPLVRRTWAAWPASSRRRDLGFLIAALEERLAPGGEP